MSEPHIPRKRFGQNFLKDQNIILKIVEALHPKPGETLVEIGPGQGALTIPVLQHISHLHVVEIDRDLSAQLQQFADKITVHQADALRFDFSTLSVASKLRVFGNLPYNISTPLLFHLLSFADSIQDMLFMLQKEVVVRMAAKPDSAEYGRLSIMMQYACQVFPLFEVGREAFTPAPKVTSKIVRLVPYGAERPFPLAKNYARFAKIVATAFQHRRKTLKNALNALEALDFASVNIDPKRRPETLSIAEYVDLSNA